jgi:NADH-quinone oxidoreductase subunit L
MIVRSNIFYSISDTASEFVAVIGAITALFAATIGLLQTDIKKILAYSTVSQLGLMFLALGVGAYSTAVFHVTTHAFFKALLFLGAGSVIHAMGGEQDIRKMGGLKKVLPITFMTMLLGTLAISGVPPFAGFFSKDEILAHVYEHNRVLWLIGSIASLFTAFYMFRLMFITFWGAFRGTHEQEHHLHESPKAMTIPLIILAVLSVLGGALGLPEFWGMPNWMSENLDSVIIRKNPTILSHETEFMLMGIAVAVALSTIYFAYQMFVKYKVLPSEKESEMKFWQKVIYNKFYVDEFYEKTIRKPLDLVSEALYKFFDTQLIDGIVDGVGTVSMWKSGIIRKLQTGHIGFYIMAMVVGVIAIMFFSLMK